MARARSRLTSTRGSMRRRSPASPSTRRHEAAHREGSPPTRTGRRPLAKGRGGPGRICVGYPALADPAVGVDHPARRRLKRHIATHAAERRRSAAPSLPDRRPVRAPSAPAPGQRARARSRTHRGPTAGERRSARGAVAFAAPQPQRRAAAARVERVDGLHGRGRCLDCRCRKFGACCGGNGRRQSRQHRAGRAGHQPGFHWFHSLFKIRLLRAHLKCITPVVPSGSKRC